MLANLAGHWLLGLPVGYVLCFWGGWGVVGLWLGLSSGLTAIGMTLVIVWRSRIEALSNVTAAVHGASSKSDEGAHNRPVAGPLR